MVLSPLKRRMPGALFLVHLEPSAQGISGMLEHLAAGGARVLPQAAWGLSAQVATQHNCR